MWRAVQSALADLLKYNLSGGKGTNIMQIQMRIFVAELMK